MAGRAREGEVRLSAAIDRFLEAAAAEGIHADVRRFPEGTKTAADAARAIGCAVEQIVKSLVFMADERPVMVFASGANRVDTAKLSAAAGARSVRRATAEEARAATGFAVGGTPPFGHPRRLRAFADRDLLAWGEIWAAAGTPDAVFPFTPRDLLRVSGAEPSDLRETRPARDPRPGSSEANRSPGTISGETPDRRNDDPADRGRRRQGEGAPHRGGP